VYKKARYLTAGDSALVIEFGDQISPEISARVRGMFLAVELAKLPALVTMNPTYRSLLVEYDPCKSGYEELLRELQQLESSLGSLNLPEPNILEVPTLYGGEGGPDLGFVCENSGLSEEQVIEIHSAKPYLIYMLGFAPGFPYLGGMDERLETPRLKTPRTKIPGGSVGIAGKQTGLYPNDSPGGWQLIGRTPLKLYDPMREPPILHRTGDYLKFIPIDEAEYRRIEEAVAAESYQYRLYAMERGAGQ